MLESITLVAAIEAPPRHRPRSPRDDALRLARTCYDHLAGRLGVAIADALVARQAVVLSEDGGEVTADGAAFSRTAWASTLPKFRAGAPSAGPASTGASGGRISPARSAPRSPIAALRAAGSSGLGDSRAVGITPRGRSGLRELFGFDPALDSSR